MQTNKQTNMASIQRSFYLLNVRAICTIFFTNEQNVLMVLLFYYKGMLEKVTTQRTQLRFSVVAKNPSVKSSACVVSRKIATERKIDFSESCAHFFQEPLIRISRNLARKYFRK